MRGRLICGALALFAVFAFREARAEVEQVWAQGVSAEGGWQNSEQWYNGCWAACATDMLAWWKKNVSAAFDLSGCTMGTSEEINRVFDKNPYFGDNGDYVWKGLEYVMTNSVSALSITYPKKIYQYLDDPWIYRFYVPLELSAQGYLIYQRGWLKAEKEKVEKALGDFMDAKGKLIAALGDERHVWVLYGVEREKASGKYTRIWVTNSSSDGKWTPGLQEFSAKYSTWEEKERLTFQRWFKIKEWDPYYEEYVYNDTLEQISPYELTYLSISEDVLLGASGAPAFRKLYAVREEDAVLASAKPSGTHLEIVGPPRYSDLKYQLVETDSLASGAWQTATAEEGTTADGRVLYRVPLGTGRKSAFFRLDVSPGKAE